MTDTRALKEKAEKALDVPRYSVDTDGNIWSVVGWRGQTRRVLTAIPNSKGYLRVRFKTSEGRMSAFVHKLVCMAFHGDKPSPAHEVRHLNGNPLDNRASNLSWGTRAENAADRSAHGRCAGAYNGRLSADKLRGRYNPLCRRGHDKEGRTSCEQCRRERRASKRLSITSV